MSRWEYQTALLQPASGWSTHKGWRLREINRQEQPGWKQAEIYVSVAAFCNQMGQQDWELVSVTYPGDSVFEIELYFKHLLQ